MLAVKNEKELAVTLDQGTPLALSAGLLEESALEEYVAHLHSTSDESAYSLQPGAIAEESDEAPGSAVPDDSSPEAPFLVGNQRTLTNGHRVTGPRQAGAAAVAQAPLTM